MKSLKFFFMLAMVMALPLAITLSASTPSEEESFLDDDEIASKSTSDLPMADSQEPTSFRGPGRFLGQSSRAALTCDKHPEICNIKGQFCCNKKCVDLKTDKFNCGKCGKKCNYSKICCEGKCVNPLSNQKHCGGCKNNCGKGNACLYGMCNYA
ncbi:hypothetical protein CRYUN_Cryun31cG0011000 [Craigia yunnanensis]